MCWFYNSPSPLALALALALAPFVPPAFIPCFIFYFLSSAVLHTDSFHHQVQLRHPLMSFCATQKCTEKTRTKTQTPKWNQAVPSSRVHVPLPRQAVHGHTAAVRLTDFWHRMAARRTQNPSQGADACFLLTYAPEMEQGGWELEGKAGDVRGGEKEGVNLEEQGASREIRIRLERWKSRDLMRIIKFYVIHLFKNSHL